jgi:hypothetical protein
MSFLEKRMSSSPFGANLINLAKQGKTKEIETIARNALATQGRNFDEEFKAFRQLYKL